MKRTLTLLSVCLTLVSVTAQQKNLIDLIEPQIEPYPSFRSSGNLADSSMTYSWTGSAWKALSKKVYTYDAQGRVSILKDYDPVTGEQMHQSVYTYHSNGEVSLVVVTANNGGSMEPFERYRYNFDSENNRTSYRKDSYSLQQWVEDEGDSVLYEYDANKRVLAYTLFQISNGVVYPGQKLIWSDFNPLNQPQTLVVQSYQGSFQNYIQLSNLTWRVGFDNFDFTPTSYIGSTWIGSWNPTVYDSSIVVAGKIQKSYQFYWDGTNIVDTSARTEYIYDQQGHRMQTKSFEYNGSSWEAVSGERDSIEYGSYNETKKQTISFFSAPGQVWEYLNEERFYYNGLSVGDINKQSLKLFPNPATTRVKLDLETPLTEVVLIDLQGKMYTLAVEENQIDVAVLPAGFYIIQVISEGERITGKLVISH